MLIFLSPIFSGYLSFGLGIWGFAVQGGDFRELMRNHVEKTINNETEAIVIRRIQGLGLGEICSLELRTFFCTVYATDLLLLVQGLAV